MFSAISASSVRKRGVSRLAAAALVSGLMAMGTMAGAGAAAADDETPHLQGGASATLDGLTTFDNAVVHADGQDQAVPAGLFEMTVDGGGKLKTYCIDIHNHTQEKAKYQETPWDQTSLGANQNAGKIRWILEHSYPQIDDLSKLAGDAGTGPLTEKTAAAGTQVAIWRYSDGVDVEAKDAQAEKLADWLEKSAQVGEEPKASLTLSPAAVSGKAGEKLGPVTVNTNAANVAVTPPADAVASGVKITDKDGEPVTTAANGTELYFDVPAGTSDGSASLGVQATTSVSVGRAFASESKSQTQILAGSSDSTVTAAATATWAKTGPIPAVSAQKNCEKGGVDVTVANQGDEAFDFELAGAKHSVEAGASQTITVPVGEDEAYDISVTGTGGFSQNFKGVLDCKTASAPSPAPSADQPSSQPSPASAGGSSSGSTGGDLAETGSSSATPMIAGIAIALVVIGGGAVFFLRRKSAANSAE
ncbi:LAETG motif-containing sortase-dependent surface protein [Streptomyces sp. NPDC088725]|uniref:LAETG motif-containing sortase-dependent surface protein n=1 Tax=Streptomyces sp. NPDC088725 TaxID=3365873 RepID=UPI003824052D